MKKPKFDKLDAEERAIEDAMGRGEYVSVSKKEFQKVKASIEAFKKNAVLNIRINRNDLESIKKKARKLGVPYQSFIGEFLHRLAQG
jgi:predicted DNA binding CopG/RHH family protein